MRFHLFIICYIFTNSILLFGKVIAPYPKYYISNFCMSLKGSVVKLGESLSNIKTSDTSVALLKLKREAYIPNLDCYLTIQAPPNFGIIALITKVKLRREQMKQDSLEISADNDNTTMIKWYGTNNEILPKVNIITKPSAGYINVRFKSGNFVASLPNKGFKIVLTIYTNANEGCGQNSTLRFDCRNRRCISSVLECDGIDNCGNDIDEQNCERSESVLGLVVFLSTLTAMAVLIMFFLLRTKKNRQEIARRFSKAYSRNRLSTMIIQTNRRFTIDPTSLKQINKELNSYASMPAIHSQIQDSQENAKSSEENTASL